MLFYLFNFSTINPEHAVVLWFGPPLDPGGSSLASADISGRFRRRRPQKHLFLLWVQTTWMPQSSGLRWVITLELIGSFSTKWFLFLFSATMVSAQGFQNERKKKTVHFTVGPIHTGWGGHLRSNVDLIFPLIGEDVQVHAGGKASAWRHCCGSVEWCSLREWSWKHAPSGSESIPKVLDLNNSITSDISTHSHWETLLHFLIFTIVSQQQKPAVDIRPVRFCRQVETGRAACSSSSLTQRHPAVIVCQSCSSANKGNDSSMWWHQPLTAWSPVYFVALCHRLPSLWSSLWVHLNSQLTGFMFVFPLFSLLFQ